MLQNFDVLFGLLEFMLDSGEAFIGHFENCLSSGLRGNGRWYNNRLMILFMKRWLRKLGTDNSSVLNC